MTMPKFEPVAYMQVSVEEGVGTYFPRLHKPEKYNAYWWRFDALHSADQLTEAYDAGKREQAASRDAEIESLKNELADALDCKAGVGPTALSMVVLERDQLRAQINVLRDALEDSYMTNPCDTNSQQKAFDKAQSALATTGDKHGSWNCQSSERRDMEKTENNGIVVCQNCGATTPEQSLTEYRNKVIDE